MDTDTLVDGVIGWWNKMSMRYVGGQQRHGESPATYEGCNRDATIAPAAASSTVWNGSHVLQQ
eukprot:14588-Eustigmatos_ZCMA.PRE.1